jgi:hypothetical protein
LLAASADLPRYAGSTTSPLDVFIQVNLNKRVKFQAARASLA